MKTSANTVIVNKIVNGDLASSSHMNQGLLKFRLGKFLIYNLQDRSHSRQSQKIHTCVKQWVDSMESISINGSIPVTKIKHFYFS